MTLAAGHLEGVGAQHAPDEPEGDAVGGGLQAGVQCVVAPLGHLYFARLHVPPSVGREPASLEAHDVGGIAAVEALAGCEHLEVVSGGVPEETQILLPLPDDLVDDRVGDAIGAETADGQVVAVVDEPLHGLLLGHALVDHGPRLLSEELARLVRIRIGEDRIDPLVQDFHILSFIVQRVLRATAPPPNEHMPQRLGMTPTKV